MNTTPKHPNDYRLVKTMICAMLLSLSTTHVQAQQQYDRVSYIELQSVAQFMEVDDRHQKQEDTVFYALPGFRINPNWIEKIIDGKRVMILTYPGYKNGRQSKKDTASNKLLPQTQNFPVYFPISGRGTRTANGKSLIIPKSVFDTLKRDTIYSIKWFGHGAARNYKLVTGQLTVPFKLRGKTQGENFQMTTDVTLGTYVGLRKRISRRNPIYLTVPATLGLSFINVNDNTTTDTAPETTDGVYPGWTWSTGAIIQFNNVNIGVVLGRDYASKVANDWIYHNKTWYSFAIGYSFVK